MRLCAPGCVVLAARSVPRGPCRGASASARRSGPARAHDRPRPCGRVSLVLGGCRAARVRPRPLRRGADHRGRGLQLAGKDTIRLSLRYPAAGEPHAALSPQCAGGCRPWRPRARHGGCDGDGRLTVSGCERHSPARLCPRRGRVGAPGAGAAALCSTAGPAGRAAHDHELLSGRYCAACHRSGDGRHVRPALCPADGHVRCGHLPHRGGLRHACDAWCACCVCGAGG